MDFDPFWSETLADHRHFKRLRAGAPLEIGYLGTTSHSVDRAFVMQIFDELVKRQANIRLTMFGSADVPRTLSVIPNSECLNLYLGLVTESV